MNFPSEKITHYKTKNNPPSHHYPKEYSAFPRRKHEYSQRWASQTWSHEPTGPEQLQIAGFVPCQVKNGVLFSFRSTTSSTLLLTTHNTESKHFFSSTSGQYLKRNGAEKAEQNAARHSLSLTALFTYPQELTPHEFPAQLSTLKKTGTTEGFTVKRYGPTLCITSWFSAIYCI